MLNWLLSRPLQVKFFASTILLVSAALLAMMLNVFMVLDRLLSHHANEDMLRSTHILAMAMMVGPAAHKPDDLRKLLREVMEMHGYCYLSVQEAHGKLLAEVGDTNAGPDSCQSGEIPLVHDGSPFGVLRYGVHTGFITEFKHSLRSDLGFLALGWLILGAVVYYGLVRRLVKPLREITYASELMAQGNLNAAMPGNLPQDELGQLATSFANMANSLRERIESQQTYAHALYAEQARLNALVSIMPVGIMFVDPARIVQHINQECRRLWGLPESEDYIGRADAELIGLAHDIVEKPESFAMQIENVIKKYGAVPPFDVKLRDGCIIRCRSSVVPDATGERYIGRIWMFEDVSLEYRRLSEAQSLAERDVLSGLYNRRRFEEDMERMFAHAQRSKQRLSLLYLDLDDFKVINDKHGHASGDKVIKSIAQALALQSRRNEMLYRLGGDEFAILVADAGQHQVEALAKRVVETVAQLKFSFDGHETNAYCSLGIATVAPEICVSSATELMLRADAAMYRAKRQGKNRWQVFDSGAPLDLGKDSR